MSGERHLVLPDVWTVGWALRADRSYLPMAARLVERTDVDSTDSVLDVGCSSGNVALTAARRGASVTGVDIDPSTLVRARQRAAAAEVADISWGQASPSALPFEAGAFDVVLSSIGHVYGEPHGAVARELLRTTSRPGRLGFTSWKPTGLVPVLQGLISSYMPAEWRSSSADPPCIWGDAATVRRRLEPVVEDVRIRPGSVGYPTPSPTAFWTDLLDRSAHLRSSLQEVHDRTDLRREALGTIDRHFDGRRNVVTLEFRLAIGRLSAASR